MTNTIKIWSTTVLLYFLSGTRSRKGLRITDEEFALLLEDRAFVDYFNVFNSLPIFGQHVLYNFIEKEFEYEPPVRKRRNFIDRRAVVSWLVEKQYPLFEKSVLYHEFILCSKIRDTEFNPESQRLNDTSGEQALPRYIFGRNVLGCCLGMQMFREFLRGTAGEKVYRCWLDIEKWSLTEEDEEKLRLKHLILQLYVRDGAVSDLSSKTKYFIYQGLLNFDIVPEHDIDETLLSVIAEGDTPYVRDTDVALIHLQRVLINSMRKYWVPRYLIHLIASLPKETIPILKRECSGDMGLVTVQRKRCFRMTFPNIYSAQTSTTSTPNPKSRVTTPLTTPQPHSTPATPVQNLQDIPTPMKSATETESEVSLDLQEGNADDEVNEPMIHPDALLSLWGGQTLARPTPHEELSSSSNHDTESLATGLQEIESLHKSSETSSLANIIETKGPNLVPLPVVSYFTGRRRMNAARVPKVNNRFLCALASEALAGSPFRIFLKKNDMDLDACYVNFWSDVRHYLDTDDTYLDCFGNQMKKTLAKMISERYLMSNAPEADIFSEGLKMSLLSSLASKDDVSLLCSAQDIVTGVLKESWTDYMKNEIKTFRIEICKKKKFNRHVVEVSSSRPATKDGTDPLIFFNANPSSDEIRSRPQSAATSQESRPWSRASEMDRSFLTEEQMWRAFELTVLLSEYGRAGMFPPNPVEIFDLIDALYSDYGSLHIRRIPAVRQEYLRSLVFKPKIDIENLRVSRKVLLDRPGMTSEKEDRPRYNRLVVRRNGILIERPGRPKAFLEVLNNPVHYDFFKRYMVANKAIYPLMFWSAVEELKETQTSRARQNMVLQIFRKYFSRSAKQGHMLDCSDDIIRQIPTMEKVPASVMICAQASVFRAMERKWYPKYLETYPTDAEYRESMNDNFQTPGPKTPLPSTTNDKSNKPKRFKRRKTMHLWHGFAYAILDFIKAMKDQAEFRLFEMYMKCETERDPAGLERSMIHSTTMASFQTRVVLRNRLVVVNKLPNDLVFWTEVERYKTQVENLRQLENISKSDTDLIYLKAKALIDCYLMSEVPPRVQINVPNELAGGINHQLATHGPQRGLFHDACIQLFPLLYFFWRRFHEDWLKNATPVEVLAKVEMQMKPRRVSSPHSDKKVPNFLNIRYSHCNITQQPMMDDDHFRINFSLLGGMKLIYPLPRGQKNGPDDSIPSNIHANRHPKSSKMSLGNAKVERKDEKESKYRMRKHSIPGPNTGVLESPNKGKQDAKPIITPQQEKARRLSQLVEELNIHQQHARTRRTSRFKSFDEVVSAALEDFKSAEPLFE